MRHAYSVTVIDAYGRRFDENYKRVRRWMTRRRFGETPESVVIERLHKMLLAETFVLNVKVHGRNEVFRLADFVPKRPTHAMSKDKAKHPTRSIGVTYGQYRDFDLFNRQLCEFEADVAHKLMLILPGFNHGAEVVMAGVVMFGEIWASKGTVI